MALRGIIVNTARLNEEQKSDMYRLMVNHYNNVDPLEFAKDLAEKNWTILLVDRTSGKIKGFSTQMLFQHQYNDQTMLVLFSGDTIIDPGHWGSQALPVTLGRLMQSILASCPGEKLYWMLISKGFRTYRFLPVFFNAFYPRYDKATPAWEQGLITSLGKRKFADRYNSTNGIVTSSAHSQSLKKELSIPSKAHQKNHHVQFFLNANPDFGRGDELICVAPFHEQNIKPYLLRCLKTKKRKHLQFRF
ncbi:hypothetical protein D1BOALGB6SA_1084 [Olavius sp. associated proteobacterium Delta 1]|nr:hypothetical protein D1BOALGB6SA_1084 [Olavius sp. associated proteobacterium Delta 1]